MINLLTSLLAVSFLIHLFSIPQYIRSDNPEKRKRFFLLFIFSGALNSGLMTALAVVVFKNPGSLSTFDLTLTLWVVSGGVFFVSVWIQSTILFRIYRRSRNPEFFHINYFGKKVYNTRITGKNDLVLMFATLPLFLFSGAYFTARLINLIRNGEI